MFMVPPFKRKQEEEEVSIDSEDEDIDSIVAETIPQDDVVEEVQSEQSEPSTEELMQLRSEMVIRTCMDLRRGENILIVCDPTTTDIGKALHDAASKFSDRVLLIVMPKGRHHGEEPPSPVANLMRQQQVVIAPTKYSLTHTVAVKQALREGARVATMPGMTIDMFIHGGMATDFQHMKKTIGDMGSLLRRRRIVNVKSESGTNITFEVNWRDWKLDDNGICNRPRMLTNLPAGKIFIQPREKTMNGTIVIDGSWEANLVEEPIFITVEEGSITDIKGGTVAAHLRQQLGEAARRLSSKEQEGVWIVSEFGFGMNANARLVGNVLEDEKRLGTCYFSIGRHTKVGLNIPGVLKAPDFWLDDTPIIRDGTFLIE